MKVVLDTNIYLSGLIFPNTPPRQILDLAKEKKIDIYISDFIISEIRQILFVKFQYNEKIIDKFIEEILKYTTVVTIKKKVHLIKTKKDDNRILECATNCQADFLITGDKKHILLIGKINGAKIVSAKEFIWLYKKDIRR